MFEVIALSSRAGSEKQALGTIEVRHARGRRSGCVHPITRRAISSPALAAEPVAA